MSFKANPFSFLKRRRSKCQNSEDELAAPVDSKPARVNLSSRIFPRSPNPLRRDRAGDRGANSQPPPAPAEAPVAEAIIGCEEPVQAAPESWTAPLAGPDFDLTDASEVTTTFAPQFHAMATPLSRTASEVSTMEDEVEPVCSLAESDSASLTQEESADFSADPWADFSEANEDMYDLSYPNVPSNETTMSPPASFSADEEMEEDSRSESDRECVTQLERQVSSEAEQLQVNEFLSSTATQPASIVISPPPDGLIADQSYYAEQEMTNYHRDILPQDSHFAETDFSHYYNSNNESAPEDFEAEGVSFRKSSNEGEELHDPDAPQFDVVLDPEADPFDKAELDSKRAPGPDERDHLFASPRDPWANLKVDKSEPILVSVGLDDGVAEEEEETSGPRRPPPPRPSPGAPGRPPPPPPPPAAAKSPKKHKLFGIDLGPLPSDPDPSFGFKNHFAKKGILPNPKKGLQNILSGEGKKKRRKRKEQELLQRIIKAGEEAEKSKAADVLPRQPAKKEEDDSWKLFQDLSARVTATVEDTVSKITVLSINSSSAPEKPPKTDSSNEESDAGSSGEENWANFEPTTSSPPQPQPPAPRPARAPFPRAPPTGVPRGVLRGVPRGPRPAPFRPRLPFDPNRPRFPPPGQRPPNPELAARPQQQQPEPEPAPPPEPEKPPADWGSSFNPTFSDPKDVGWANFGPAQPSEAADDWANFASPQQQEEEAGWAQFPSQEPQADFVAEFAANFGDQNGAPDDWPTEVVEERFGSFAF